MAVITMKALLEAGVHFGHQVRRWNPKMLKYIYGARNDVHIIDLQKSLRNLRRVYKFVRDEISLGKTILFVGTKKQARDTIEQEAKRCDAFYITKRWLGGTLTNFDAIFKSIKRLKELEKMKQEGIFDLLSKKERSKREKEKQKLEEILSGIKNMTKLPDILFIIDPVKEEVAVREAKKLKISIIAVCDTDSDPDIIDYPIPGNDDALRSVKLFVSIIADAVLEGRRLKEQQESQQKLEQENTLQSGILTDELDKEIKIEQQTETVKEIEQNEPNN